jgi:O-antigen/teichoic acid export membrane protein
VSEAQAFVASDLERRTVGGVAWSGGSRVLQQVVQFATTVVLARILTPEDFGLVALIIVFTGFATVLLDFGFAAALIQRLHIEDRHLYSAFWVNVATGVALALLLLFLAPAFASFYDEPRLVPLTMVIGANFVLTGLAAVQAALLQRAMNFRRISVIENTATLAAGALAIAAAASGYGVWSLVILTLATTFLRCALLWLLSDWRPRLRLDLDALRDLWGFSVNLAGVLALNYWSRSADNLLIGKFLGPASLGIYGRAYTLMLLPITQVQAVIGRVMFPALSQIQGDPLRVRRIYLRAIAIIGLVSFPVVVALFVTAEPFVLTLFGPKWAEVVPILQILCIPALIQSIGTTAGWIYQSQGRTDWMLRWNLVTGPLTIGAFAIGIQWGVLGVATAYAVRTVLLTYFNYAIPGRLIEMKFSHVVRTVRGVLGASLAMGAVMWTVEALIPASWAPGAHLALDAAVGASVYLLLLRALSPQPWIEFKAMATSFLRHRAARPSTAASQGTVSS